MSFGKSVDLVIDEHHIDVHIAPDHVDKVIVTNRHTIAVAGYEPHTEIRVCHLYTCGNRSTSSVDSVHAIGIHIIGEA